jgi:biopolymer transport protein TolR
VIIHDDQKLGLRDRSKSEKEVAISRSELADEIKAAQARNPDQPVLIAGDKSVRYEVVLNVMDELQKQQVTRIGLLVQTGK